MHLPFRYRAASLLLLAFTALPASASDWGIQAGRSYSSGHGTNALFVEGTFDEHPIGSSRFTWSPDVSLGWINGRNQDSRNQDSSGQNGSGQPVLPAQPGVRRSAWILAGGARFHYGEEGDWYQPLFFSFQPALHTGNTFALDSSYEFVSTLGWQGQYFSIQVRHVSDGGFHTPNRGETMALIGMRFDM